MGEYFSRRGVLAGMAVTAANLLFRRDLVAAPQGVPAVGNTHLLTLVAVSEKTLRLRIIQQGKQGPANETGIVPRTWPEPLESSDAGTVPWGDFKVHFEERPWQVTISDSAGRQRQQLHLDPTTRAIQFALGDG